MRDQFPGDHSRMKRVALYARISTYQGKQFWQNQIAEMLAFADTNNWEVVKQYVDEGSGLNGERTALKQLLADAFRHRFDVVLVWALDRFTCEGVFQAFKYIEQLKSSRVEFISVTEPHFTSCGAFGECFLALSAWMARQERLRLRERIAAGLARARQEGKMLGRPARQVDLSRANGKTRGKAAAELGISRATLYRRLKRAEA